MCVYVLFCFSFIHWWFTLLFYVQVSAQDFEYDGLHVHFFMELPRRK